MLPYADTTRLRITQVYGVKNSKQSYVAGVHSGLDIVSDGDKTVVAIRRGRVIRSKSYGNWGEYIVIEQEDGLYCIYAHLSKRFVGVGDAVEEGQGIGVEGRSGNVTDSHLHIELEKEYYDPFSHVDIARYLGIKNEVGPVTEVDIFAEDRAWAVAQGISDGSDPDRPATRKEVWAMIRRAIG